MKLVESRHLWKKLGLFCRLNGEEACLNKIYKVLEYLWDRVDEKIAGIGIAVFSFRECAEKILKKKILLRIEAVFRPEKIISFLLLDYLVIEEF